MTEKYKKITRSIKSIHDRLLLDGWKEKADNKYVLKMYNKAVMEGIKIDHNKLIIPYAVDDELIEHDGYDQVGTTTRLVVEWIFIGEIPKAPSDPDQPGSQAANNNNVPTIMVLPELIDSNFEANFPGGKQVLLMLQKTHSKYIKERKGNSGKLYQYVEGSYMIRALNFLSKFNWDFNIVESREDTKTTTINKGKTDEKQEIKTFYTVLGKLTVSIDGSMISKEQFGSQELKKGMEPGDALKAAATDSLKKCASMLGIAQDVYSQEADTGD